jgi:sugar transferase (PEP-CTERM/EpsH1 system associated)
MKLVVVLSRFPYPLEKGDKLRAYYQLVELAKNHEITLCCLTDKKVSEPHKAKIKAIVNDLHIYQLNKFSILFNLLRKSFSNKPFQTGYFYQSWIRRKIHKVIVKTQPDHLYCQLIRTTEYVKSFHQIPKTLDYMDALGKGMQRRAAIAKGIKKWIFAQESNRLTAYENRIFDYFNHHTIISAQDRAYINHPQNKSISIIENGVAENFANYETTTKKKYDLVFTGNMNYPPNVACAVYIVENILPQMTALNRPVSLLLSGANPNHQVKQLGNLPNVHVTGWVDDIRESYAQGKIFIAPLFIGTGLQNKLLEAMLMGLPSITTELANNALKAEENTSVLIAATPKEFAQHILDLLENEEKFNQLASNGKAWVAKTYSWENSVKKLAQLFTS